MQKPLENRLIFIKIRETGMDPFHWFLKNRLVKFKKIQKSEIKNSIKKLEFISRFLVETDLKKSKYYMLKYSWKWKIHKSLGFLETHSVSPENQACLILSCALSLPVSSGQNGSQKQGSGVLMVEVAWRPSMPPPSHNRACDTNDDAPHPSMPLPGAQAPSTADLTSLK
jgi:hypothetical protein